MQSDRMIASIDIRQSAESLRRIAKVLKCAGAGALSSRVSALAAEAEMINAKKERSEWKP